MGQQGGSRRAGNRDDEKEERKAHGAAAKIGHTGPPPQEPRRDERHDNQEDRLQDEFLARRGLVREDECDRGNKAEEGQVEDGGRDERPSGVTFQDRDEWIECVRRWYYHM